MAGEVIGEKRARPALKLNLSSVIFSSETKTFHVHSFTYNANGATITATCSGEGDCTYKNNGITLTLTAPESLTYGGTAKAATISGYPATCQDRKKMPIRSVLRWTRLHSTALSKMSGLTF